MCIDGKGLFLVEKPLQDRSCDGAGLHTAIARAIVGAIPMTSTWNLLVGSNWVNKAEYAPGGIITVYMDFVLGAKAYDLCPRGHPQVTQQAAAAASYTTTTPSTAAAMDAPSEGYESDGYMVFSIDPAAWLRMNFGKGFLTSTFARVLPSIRDVDTYSFAAAPAAEGSHERRRLIQSKHFPAAGAWCPWWRLQRLCISIDAEAFDPLSLTLIWSPITRYQNRQQYEAMLHHHQQQQAYTLHGHRGMGGNNANGGTRDSPPAYVYHHQSPEDVKEKEWSSSSVGTKRRWTDMYPHLARSVLTLGAAGTPPDVGRGDGALDRLYRGYKRFMINPVSEENARTNESHRGNALVRHLATIAAEATGEERGDPLSSP
jgi:hypothetical protein